MPPTRGHDLKRLAVRLSHTVPPDAPHTGARLETYNAPVEDLKHIWMPPTRGHDLKLLAGRLGRPGKMMPPTRGHDLKLTKKVGNPNFDLMPPTRGHDLKLEFHLPGNPE